MGAYLKVEFAKGKWRAGMAALGVALAVAVFSACGGSGDTVNTGDGADNGGSASGAPTTTEPVGSVDASRSMSQLPGTLVSGDWQITVSNYSRDGNIVTVPVELTNVGSQAQSPPGTEFGNYAIIDDKGSEFSIRDGGALALPDGFIRQVNPGDSLPIVPLAFSVPASASGLNFQFKGGYTSPEVLFQLAGYASRIAFASDGVIYTMFSDGSDLRQLTDNESLSRYPSWSPDGARIAFVSRRSGAWEIYTMSSDGSDVRQLTTDSPSGRLSIDNDAGVPDGDSGAPSWSPDGSRIAFVSCCEYANEIYTMSSSDGSDVRQLTDNQSFDGVPSWSPDGSRIAFVSNRHLMGFLDGGFEIYTMLSDGSDVRQLTDNQSENWTPSWSPDGSRIAFSSLRVINTGLDDLFEFPVFRTIYTMSLDGSDVMLLTDNPALSPAWSSDGSRIAFVSGADNPVYFEIFTMASDGSDERRILPGMSYFTDISWSPLLPLVDDFGGELVDSVDSGEFDLVVDGRIWVGGAIFSSSFGSPTPGVGWEIRTASGASEVALAEHLASIGEDVRMFCAWLQPECHTQKELFGAEAWEIVRQVNYVECLPENRYQGVTPECAPLTSIVGYPTYPTWLIDSTPTGGALNLEDLAELTGYTGPTDFRFIQP